MSKRESCVRTEQLYRNGKIVSNGASVLKRGECVKMGKLYHNGKFMSKRRQYDKAGPKRLLCQNSVDTLKQDFYFKMRPCVRTGSLCECGTVILDMGCVITRLLC